jgi:hypothetical protein
VTQAWDFVNAGILWQRPGPHWHWGPYVTDLVLTEGQIEALKEAWLNQFNPNPIAVFRKQP